MLLLKEYLLLYVIIYDTYLILDLLLVTHVQYRL